MKVLQLVAKSDHVSSKLFSKLSIDNTINDSLGRHEFNRHGIEIKFVQLGNKFFFFKELLINKYYQCIKDFFFLIII